MRRCRSTMTSNASRLPATDSATSAESSSSESFFIGGVHARIAKVESCDMCLPLQPLTVLAADWLRVVDFGLLFVSGLSSGRRKGQSMQPLTKRQREILDYLNKFIAQHGYARSLEEI